MPHPAEALQRVVRALSNPTRRALVERLARAPASHSELARLLSVSLSVVGEHLTILEDSGLVRTEKVGRASVCHLDPDGLRVAELWLAERRRDWSQQSDGRRRKKKR